MVTQVVFDTLGQAVGGLQGTAPQLWVGTTDQTLGVVTTAGAVATLVADGIFKVRDIVFLNYDLDGTPGQSILTVTAASSGSLEAYPAAVGGALLAANNLDDVADVATSRTNLGLGTLDNVRFANIQAGASGAAGNFKSYPSAATSGYLGLLGVANAGDYAVVISNRSHGQATTYSFADVGAATGSILNCAVAADPASNLIAFDVACGQAALASGGSVTLYTSGTAKQYKISGLWLNSGGTNFSGGGGDRLGQVTDGTTVYSVIPAASLQTLANATWGATALPFPASAAINTSTAAAANLVFKYSGGAADYTAGSVVVSGLLQRVA